MRAIQGTLDNREKDDLLDLFSMGLPAEQNTKVAVESIAHKAMLQELK